MNCLQCSLPPPYLGNAQTGGDAAWVKRRGRNLSVSELGSMSPESCFTVLSAVKLRLNGCWCCSMSLYPLRWSFICVVQYSEKWHQRKHKRKYLSRSIPLLLWLRKSPCLIFAIYLVPGTRFYYLYSHLFRRPPQQLILTKKNHQDANNEIKWLSISTTHLSRAQCVNHFSKELYSSIWPMSRDKNHLYVVV